jgi:hypothetical protein
VASKFESIRLALTSPLQALLPELDKVLPNQPTYTPRLGAAYLEVFVLPNQPSASTLGRNGQDAHTGTLQVSLRFPREQTDLPLLRAADEIETAYQQFIRGGHLSHNGVSVRITSVGVGAPRVDDAWYFAPVNINYESHIKGVI